jgi:hypothetical protein
MTKEVGSFVSYDTVAMAFKKVYFITRQKLGGAMWWEISGDKTGDDGSIVTNVSWMYVIVEMSGVLTCKGRKENGRREWRRYRVIVQLASVPGLKV